MKILFFGDSIIQGFWDADGGWVERLRKHYDSIALQDLINNIQPKIFNLGILGDTTCELLQRIEDETKIRVKPDDSSIIVISIGTNDCSFENNKQLISPNEFNDNLEKIIKIIEPLTDQIILVGNTACDEAKTTPTQWGSYYTNIELQRFEDIVKNIAIRYNLPYVPIFEKFKLKLDAGENLLADGLHPNNAGHQFIAGQILSTLDVILNKLS
jgi:lysophospholipase L1-like esterase